VRAVNPVDPWGPEGGRIYSTALAVPALQALAPFREGRRTEGEVRAAAAISPSRDARATVAPQPMRILVLSLMSALAVQLPAQGERDPDAVWKSIEQHDRLIELRWRRDASGNLEYAPAANDQASFQRLFAKGLANAVDTLSLAGWGALLLHGGDVLSLTDGARHLGRLGIDTGDAQLAAFVRSAMPPHGTGLALLDRLVAIDLLRRHGTPDARKLVDELAATESLAPELRERARGAAVARIRLDATSLLVPASADIFVAIDHTRMPQTHALVAIEHLTGLLASAQVIGMLKMPYESDYLIGESESLFVTELPFELARRFGNYRPDHTCLALSLPMSEKQLWSWSVCSAGRFEPAAIEQQHALLGIAGLKCDRKGDEVALVWPGGVGRVAATRVNARSEKVEAAPAAAALAERLLSAGDGALGVYVPAGSKLLELAAAQGFAGIRELDATVAFDADGGQLTAIARMADSDAAKALATSIRRQLGTAGVGGLLLAFASMLDEELMKVDVDAATVRVMLPLPGRMMDARLMKAQLLAKVRRDTR